MSKFILTPSILSLSRQSLSRPTSFRPRTYATSSSSGSSTLWILGGAAVAAGAGYWAFGGSNVKLPDPAEIKEAEQKLKSKVEQATGLNLPDTGLITPVALDKNDWREFKLTKVDKYNHDTSRFTFELPDNLSSGITVASCLLTLTPPFEEGKKPIIRPYTPVKDGPGFLQLLVKAYPNGNASKYIHKLKIGETLKMKGPIPKWPWKANEFETIGLIAGGSGITPMYQLIKAIDENPEDKTKVVLFFSNKEEKDILLKPEFEDIAKRKPEQFKFIFSLDKAPNRWWKGPTGYLTKETLAQHLPPPSAEKAKIFVCGPPGQMNAVSGDKKSPSDQGELSGLLAEMGYTKEQVYKF